VVAAAAGLGSCIVALGLGVPRNALAGPSERIVYGADDRIEYYEAPPNEQSLASAATVALVPNSYGPPLVTMAPELGPALGLCPGEPFANQPAAAFCSGVLIDQDIVLTAGHCVRLFALTDFSVVFGYYYAAPGHLASTDADVYEPVEILAEALDPEGATPRLDYALLRIHPPVAPPHAPARVYVRPSPLALGDPLLFIGAGGGVPLKLDSGGRVQDPRAAEGDYFLADTDTSAGASGGGAFDERSALVGILARGGTDYAPTSAGCLATVHVANGSSAQEAFTYAGRAVQALCAQQPSASSLCRSDCGDPCEATSSRDSPRSGGCSVLGRTTTAVWSSAQLLLGVVLLCGRRRR
jgi:hypothetical protein